MLGDWSGDEGSDGEGPVEVGSGDAEMMVVAVDVDVDVGVGIGVGVDGRDDVGLATGPDVAPADAGAEL